MRKLSLIFPVLALLLAACGGGTDEQWSVEYAVPVAPTVTPSATAPPAPASSFPALRPHDFVGYEQSEPGVWKPDGSSRGLPVLMANQTQVTAFRYGGFTCQVKLDGLQATPARVLVLFSLAEREGLEPGTFEYTSGGAVVGRYTCG